MNKLVSDLGAWCCFGSGTQFLYGIYPSVQDILTDSVLNLHVFGVFFFVWKGIMLVQKNVEQHFLETFCQCMRLMHVWDIGSTIISHSGSYHLSCCQTILRYICLSQGGESMSMHMEMERKALLLAHPYHITTSGASGQTVKEFSSIYPRSCPERWCRRLVTLYSIVHFQGSFSCNLMNTTKIWLLFHSLGGW